MNSLSRSTALKIAAAITFLISAISLFFMTPLLFEGELSLDAHPGPPPYIAVLTIFICGIVGIIAAYGAWKGQRWGIILTILVNVINGLLAAPGIFFAPKTFYIIMSTLTFLLDVLVVVLCLWRDRRAVIA